MKVGEEGHADGEDSAHFFVDVHFRFFDFLHDDGQFFFHFCPKCQQFFRFFHVSMKGDGVNGDCGRGCFSSDKKRKYSGECGHRSAVQFSFHVEEAENHEEGGTGYAEVEAQPEGVGAQGGMGVQEEAHGEAAAPVGQDHEDEGNPGILEAPKNPLDGGGNSVEELPAGAVDEELSCNEGHRCVVGVDGADGASEENGEGGGHHGACHGHHEACFFIPAGQGHVIGTYGGGNEDGEGHGAGDGKHVYQAGEVVRNLVGRQGVGAVAGEEYDDEAEEAHFHEDGKAAGYAYHQVFTDICSAEGKACENGSAFQFLRFQNHQNKEDQQESVGNHGGKACADAAQGRHAAVAVDEEVVENAVHHRCHEEEFHGNGGGACGVGEAAQRNHEGDEEYYANHGHEVVPGNVLHCRLQGQGGHEVVNEENIGCRKKDPHGKADNHAASHDEGKGFSFFPSDELCHKRGSRHEESDDGGQEGVKESRSHGHAGQVVGAGMAGHGCINERYSRRGYLGNQNRYHHRQKLLYIFFHEKHVNALSRNFIKKDAARRHPMKIL